MIVSTLERSRVLQLEDGPDPDPEPPAKIEYINSKNESAQILRDIRDAFGATIISEFKIERCSSRTKYNVTLIKAVNQSIRFPNRITVSNGSIGIVESISRTVFGDGHEHIQTDVLFFDPVL